MKKIVLVLMTLTILTKFIGFFREITLSYFYGVSNVSDAYLVALTIPTVIFSVIGVGIKTTYIPMFSRILKEKGPDKANRFTNSIINLLLVISTIIVIFVCIFTDSVVGIFASGFTGDTLTLAINFTRITIFSIYFIGIFYIFQGYLQMKNNFVIPALIGLPLNLFLIISIILSTIFDIKILAIGKVIAVISQLVFIIPFLVNKGYKFNIILDINDHNIKEMIYLALPVILGTSVNQINRIVDRTIASQIAIGGISALNYANRLNDFVLSIFVTSLVTVLYTNMSKMAADQNMVALKESASEAITSINLLVIPATIGCMVFSEPIIKLLFGRGAFDSKALYMTSYALFFYSIGMVGFGLREVLARVFYSLKDTKTPMINASIGMTLNIVLNIILSKYLGIGGLALATSLSAILTSAFMFVSLRKKIGPFGMKQISISFLKILFASLIMGTLAKLSFNYLTASLFSQNLSLIVSIGIGALTYFVIIYFMKIDDVDVIVNAVKKKLSAQ